MISIPKTYRAPIALTVAASLAVGIVYLSGISTSEDRATVKAADSCSSLKTDRAITALNRALPNRSEYSFDEDPEEARPVEATDTYSNSCFVRADRDILLSARARMMVAEPPNTWEEEVFKDVSSGGRRVTGFAAGIRGLASPEKAAVFIPCVPKGEIPGGGYNLSVVVDLKERGDVSDAKLREDLISLTLSAANYAHKSSKCTLPSRI
ncbi:hypothetical protein ABZ953_12285 [Streptomyces sp. NPDC046465]|uniref:hypothetical protein n=1 Tax=Streptomyces sp. NPDC046465 TaxID=3155810 RepID=UPI003403A04D